MPLIDGPPESPIPGPSEPSEAAERKRRHRCTCGCGELVGPPPKRNRPPVEATKALAFIRQRVDAYRERMRDTEDPVGAEVIAGVAELRRELDEVLDQAVIDGRAHHDLSWSQVAALTGMSKAGVIKRWGERAPGTRPSGGQPSELR